MLRLARRVGAQALLWRTGVTLTTLFVFAGCGGLVALPSTENGSSEPSSPPDGGPGAVVDAASGPATKDAGHSGYAGEVGPALGPPAGGPDGVCFAGDVRRGTYDPDCVYVVGTAVPGSSGHDVLFDPADPSRLVAGFGEFHSRPTVRPSDGQIILTAKSPAHAYVFHPGFTTETEAAQFARHTLLPTPACTSQNGLMAALVYPDKGGGLYACGAINSHYYVLGTSTEFAPTPMYRVDALGPNDTALVRAQGGFTVVEGGVLHPVAAIAADATIAARSRSGGGFFVVIATPPNEEGRELYAIATDGTAQDLGAYVFPAVMPAVQFYAAALEPSGALISYGEADFFGSAIVRLRVDAPAEKLFLDDGMQSVHLETTPMLVTGP